MTPLELSTKPRKALSRTVNFGIISGAFLVYTLVSWPILLSFDLWIFKDRSSFLNLDYLYFTRHLRLGVDVGYSYGLLPVLLHHLVFALFGQGYKPMIGLAFLVLFLSALFWACLLEHLPPGRSWLIAVVALSPIILIVNPNWPYSMATLSMMFALLFVLRDRIDLAFAISAIGCLSVPSLPLVLAVLLVFCIFYNWWRAPDRSLSQLARLLAPGLATYAVLAALLGAVFGFASVAATALPLAGARYYKASGYNKASAFVSYLHPAGNSTKYYIAYYLGSSVTWFMLCTLLLVASSILILLSLVRNRKPSAAGTVVVLFSVIQVVFIFFAYGARGQHVLFEGILAAATLVGISLISAVRVRNAVLLVYFCTGVLAGLGVARKTVEAWRTTAPAPGTLGLYADAGIAHNWSDVLSLSQQRKTLLLSYSTGQHLYYPTINDPEAWFMLSGLVLPSQEDAIVEQMEQADIVVEDLTGPPPVISNRIEAQLATMHVLHSDGPFRIFERAAIR